MPRTNQAVGVTGAVFGIAGEMRRLPAYFDNPFFLPYGTGRDALFIFWDRGRRFLERGIMF